MRFSFQETSDGSWTVFDQAAGEYFKSRHSARLESEEVFFRPGVAENPWFGKAAPFRVLELGFGLGTNFLNLLEKNLSLEFVSIERDLAGLSFFLEKEPHPALAALAAEKTWTNGPVRAEIREGDFLEKMGELTASSFHAVYFDPFSPKANPEAWTEALFTEAARLLAPGGRLVTYSVSRVAKDAAACAGLSVEKRELPPALQKRAALIARKAC